MSDGSECEVRENEVQMLEESESGRELDSEELEQVSGGGRLADLMEWIYTNGHAEQIRDILNSQGKKAAVDYLLSLRPEVYEYATKAVSILSI